MIPQGGFTTIFHLAILLGKLPRAKILSIFFVTTISFITFRIGSLSVMQAYQQSPLLDFISQVQYCQEVTRPESPKQVVLRLDDVQAFAWRDLATSMMDDAFARNMKVSAVTIPIRINTDRTLINYLKSHRCNLEVVLHGYDNTEDPPEFAYLNQEQAKQKIDLGLAELAQITPTPIRFFVPPENVYSKETATVLSEKNIQISAEGGKYFDYTSTTYDFSHDKLHDQEHVVTECEARLVTDSICIIMLHPQDFTDERGHRDQEKYDTYIQILDYLQEKNYRVVTFSELPPDTN